MDSILKVTGFRLDCKLCSSGKHVVWRMSPAYLWIQQMSCIGILRSSLRRVECTWAACCNYVWGHDPPLYHSLRKGCDQKFLQDVKRTFYEAAKSILNKPKRKRHMRNFSVLQQVPWRFWSSWIRSRMNWYACTYFRNEFATLIFSMPLCYIINRATGIQAKNSYTFTVVCFYVGLSPCKLAYQ